MLDTLLTRFPENDVLYWQDKAGREVDFVIRRTEGRVDLVECKLNPDKLNATPVAAFRERYPNGDNYVATPLAREPYRMRRGGLTFVVCSSGDIGAT